eukprot:NODE_858_length_1408_cov_88.005151_g713_i0.p1 GENE.NODE_858_length_1408_cov_88.005151_g713_i0~~NODE_858_length_1408_cov_88.005151_g713_i0.p1  ORF type:complete len:328 (+),score=21.44 NODE_858_length_1408_cov_88.005151_g713_i0:233-1216(+)
MLGMSRTEGFEKDADWSVGSMLPADVTSDKILVDELPPSCAGPTSTASPPPTKVGIGESLEAAANASSGVRPMCTTSSANTNAMQRGLELMDAVPTDLETDSRDTTPVGVRNLAMHHRPHPEMASFSAPPTTWKIRPCRRAHGSFSQQLTSAKVISNDSQLQEQSAPCFGTDLSALVNMLDELANARDETKPRPTTAVVPELPALAEEWSMLRSQLQDKGARPHSIHHRAHNTPGCPQTSVHTGRSISSRPLLEVGLGSAQKPRCTRRTGASQGAQDCVYPSSNRMTNPGDVLAIKPGNVAIYERFPKRRMGWHRPTTPTLHELNFT